MRRAAALLCTGALVASVGGCGKYGRPERNVDTSRPHSEATTKSERKTVLLQEVLEPADEATEEDEREKEREEKR